MPAVDTRTAARRHTRRWLVTVTAALAAAIALTGCSTGDTTHDQRSDTYRGDIATVVVDIEDLGGPQIGTTSAALNVRIVGTDRDGVQVDRTLEHTDGDLPTEHIDQDGDTLTIAATCPDGFTIGAAVCQAAYELQVPYGTAVHAATHTGNLTAEDTRGEIEMRSLDGDVTVVAPGEPRYAVEASSQDGEASVEVPQDPDGVPMRVTSDSGDVTVRPDAP